MVLSSRYVHVDSEGRIDTEYVLSATSLTYTTRFFRAGYTTPDTESTQVYAVTERARGSFEAYQDTHGLCVVKGDSAGKTYFGDPATRDGDNCPTALDTTVEFRKM